MTTEPTLLGYVESVTGSSVNVRLIQSVSSGLSIINGTTYRVGQVGSFVRLPLGYYDLYGVVSGVGASAIPEDAPESMQDSGRWMKIELVGEGIGSDFERGISQHPKVKDSVHIVTVDDLKRIYDDTNQGQITIGSLSSAESLHVKLDLDKLVTRHSAILGATGSGKSTAVASILRSIVKPQDENFTYPNSRILLIDIHGEYGSALGDIASVFKINPNKGEKKLVIPFWALKAKDIMDFMIGDSSGDKGLHFFDKITELKKNNLSKKAYAGADVDSLTVDTPIPYSLKKLWFDLIDFELMTLQGENRDEPALKKKGDANTLEEPTYEKHGLGAAGPFLNPRVLGIRRQLNSIRSRLLDHQYDFLLHPDEWEPDLDGTVTKDLPELLKEWLGNEHSITILDLSGVPSPVVIQLIGALINIIFESLFWSREKSEGSVRRPLLVVMEEAHRYLQAESSNSARDIVQRIVKEGRKYGIGAMIVSQRPSEVDETILSQCGTFIVLRLNNASDRSKVQGTMPDNLAGLMDALPVLRTGEAVITGEAAKLPARCRITLPDKENQPDSQDPLVSYNWKLDRIKESYERVAASWRAQSTIETLKDLDIKREKIED